MDHNHLTDLGFSSKKALLYTALLNHGRGSAAKLAELAGIKRTTAYDLLKELHEENLVSISFTGNRREFIAEPPENLQKLIDNKLKTVDRLMPALKELFYAHTHRPRVRYFEGVEGLRHVHEELLKVKTKEYFYFGSIQGFVDALGKEYLESFVQRRIAKKIWSNALRIRSHELPGSSLIGGDQNYRRVRYLSQSADNYVANLTLYDGKIAVCSTSRENYAMIIESDEMYSILKLIWDQMWQVAQP